MADYIDRDKYCAITCRCDKNYCGRTSCAIWTAKSEDVAPVVHGMWIENIYVDPYGAHWTKYKCNLCGRIEVVKEPYCNCGAKMDAEAQRWTPKGVKTCIMS